MREFTTSSKRASGKADLIEFKVDGDVFQAFRPDGSSLAYLIASAANPGDGQKLTADVLDYLEALLEPDSSALFRKRLLNPRDSLDINKTMEIFHYILEEMSGNPTGSSNGSSPGRRKTGASSTGR